MFAVYGTKLKFDNEMLHHILGIMRKLQIRNRRIGLGDYTEMRVECYQDIKMILKELVDNSILQNDYFSQIKVVDDEGKVYQFATITQFLRADITEIRGVNATH